MKTEFRKFQFVATTTDIPGAHKTRDGRSVGIYVPAHVPSRMHLGSSTPEPGALAATPEPEPVPEHVAFARPDGTNLMRLSDDGNHAVKVAVALEHLADLTGLDPWDAEHVADMPEARRPVPSVPGLVTVGQPGGEA